MGEARVRSDGELNLTCSFHQIRWPIAAGGPFAALRKAHLTRSSGNRSTSLMVFSVLAIASVGWQGNWKWSVGAAWNCRYPQAAPHLRGLNACVQDERRLRDQGFVALRPDRAP
jgi:hypothetical protein